MFFYKHFTSNNWIKMINAFQQLKNCSSKNVLLSQRVFFAQKNTQTHKHTHTLPKITECVCEHYLWYANRLVIPTVFTSDDHGSVRSDPDTELRCICVCVCGGGCTESKGEVRWKGRNCWHYWKWKEMTVYLSVLYLFSEPIPESPSWLVHCSTVSNLRSSCW